MSTQFFGRNAEGQASEQVVAVRFWGGRNRGTVFQWQRDAGEGFTASFFEEGTEREFTGTEFVEVARDCDTQDWA